MSSNASHASRDHFFLFFFPFFCLQTFMNCDMAAMTLCLLQKLWRGHNDCHLQKFSSDGLHYYWDGLPLQCTTHFSDGFASCASGSKPLLALLMLNLCTYYFLTSRCSASEYFIIVKSWWSHWPKVKVRVYCPLQ